MIKYFLRYLSKSISYLLVPPAMNLFIFIVFSLNYETYPRNITGLAISFLFGFLLPIITFIIFRKKGKIVNDDATIKEERTIPYIYAIGFSLFAIILTAIYALDERLIMLWLIYLINSILIININRFWKISAHTMGVGMPLGALIYYNNFTLLLVGLIMISLVSFSRLYLRVHTFSQVIAGALIGILISFILLNNCL